MVQSSLLNDAKQNKKDEFYTDVEVIVNEMAYYKNIFKDKVVYCNCDDVFYSNFANYFLMNFKNIGLKGLIVSGFRITTNDKYGNKPVVLEIYNLDKTLNFYNKDDFLLNDCDNYIKYAEEDSQYVAGDFRSSMCKDLLNKADIVITNPPFSLFREYVKQVYDLHKDMLIIGNVNALSYKDIFELIKEDKLWLGPSITSGDRKFFVPDDYELKAATCGFDNGRKFIMVKGVRWFTTLDHIKRHNFLELSTEFSYFQSPYYYPKYDNYDAINVDKTCEIPYDYFGKMGVPITFLDKYCSGQFTIIGLDRYTIPKEYLVGGRAAIDGKPKYARVIIERKTT